MDLGYIANILLLVFGFGFVIFWHELGHFLAAKWAGVKVEQFAVGFGQAMVCWRKGIGFTVGTSAPEVEKRVNAERQRSENAIEKDTTGELSRPLPETETQILHRLGLGETEYRLNWIPLGGYVKMLGQDDLRPTADQTDPRSYNNRPIGKRMVIVSAGVVMNIILAAIGFCVLFLWGFKAPPAIVGSVTPGSPAQIAGIEVGDRIVEIDGKYQHDFTKIRLNIALAEADRSIPVLIEKPDGSQKTVNLTPKKSSKDSASFLAIGVGPSPVMRGIDKADLAKIQKQLKELEADPAFKLVGPGETIIAVNGEPVSQEFGADGHKKSEYFKLDRAVQNSGGNPVTLTVRDDAGKTSDRQVTPEFMTPFGEVPLEFAGLQPRVVVETIAPSADESVRKALNIGDVILAVRQSGTGDSTVNPAFARFQECLKNSGTNGQTVTLTVLRDGKEVQLPELKPRAVGDRYILGFGPGVDTATPIIADPLLKSPAAEGKFANGDRITSINGSPVKTWFDIQRLLASADPSKPVVVTADRAGVATTLQLPLTPADHELLAASRYHVSLLLTDLIDVRKTSNVFQALAWGAGETRDLMVQFYITLRRMVERSVDPSNLTGPIGIVRTGALFADQGADRLLWFLSMISANLAVVNFLPIPVMDGGLFVFLLLEKIKGRPISLRTQTIAQFVGLVLILGVFLFATYHDIFRTF